METTSQGLEVAKFNSEVKMSTMYYFPMFSNQSFRKACYLTLQIQTFTAEKRIYQSTEENINGKLLIF